MLFYFNFPTMRRGDWKRRTKTTLRWNFSHCDSCFMYKSFTIGHWLLKSFRLHTIRSFASHETTVKYFSFQPYSDDTLNFPLWKLFVFQNSLWLIRFLKYSFFFHHQKTLYSIDFINQINDGRLKHEKIDKALLNYEKDHPDRGYFSVKNSIQEWLPVILVSNTKWTLITYSDYIHKKQNESTILNLK
mgnify:CR=1 FL=1